VYSGYLHLLPRSVAAVAAALPLRWSPPIFFCVACGIATGAAAVSWICAREGLKLSSPASFLVAATVLLLPAGGYEVAGNLTNAQWYCLAATTVFVAAWLAGYRGRTAPTVVGLGVAGLTTPLLILMLPFVVVGAAWRRRRYDIAVLAAVASTSVVQGVAKLTASPGPPIKIPFHQLFRLYTVRVADGSVIGDRLLPLFTQMLGQLGAEVLGVAIVVGLGVATLRLPGPLRLACAFCVVTSGLVLVVSVVSRSTWFDFPGVGLVQGPGQRVLFDGRYMAVPALCLFLVGVISVDRWWRPARRTVATIAGSLISVVLVASLQVNLFRPTLSNWNSQLTSARSGCAAAHGAGTFTLTSGPFNGFAMVVGCREVFGSG